MTKKRTNALQNMTSLWVMRNTLDLLRELHALSPLDEYGRKLPKRWLVHQALEAALEKAKANIRQAPNTAAEAKEAWEQAMRSNADESVVLSAWRVYVNLSYQKGAAPLDPTQPQ